MRIVEHITHLLTDPSNQFFYLASCIVLKVKWLSFGLNIQTRAS